MHFTEFFKFSLIYYAAYDSLFTVDGFFFALFTFVCWCSGSYCTGRYACTVHHCSLWECLWSKVGQKAPWFILPTNPLSLRWASIGEGWCRQVQLFCFSTHTHQASVHNLPNTNSYDEVCTKVIIFSASSLIILSSLCQSLQLFVQTNMNILFNCDVTNEVVFFAEILLDDFMLTHPIFLASDKFQQVLLQQYPFSSPEQ